VSTVGGTFIFLSVQQTSIISKNPCLQWKKWKTISVAAERRPMTILCPRDSNHCIEPRFHFASVGANSVRVSGGCVVGGCRTSTAPPSISPFSRLFRSILPHAGFGQQMPAATSFSAWSCWCCVPTINTSAAESRNLIANCYWWTKGYKSIKYSDCLY